MKELPRKVSAPLVRAMKGRGEKIVAVTAYDATFARLLDEGGADVLLVGDSLGMVVQGLQHTLPVTLEEMVYHTRMVARGTQRAHVVADLPFLSYQVSSEQALQSSGALIKDGGAEAVKLEGGVRSAEAVRRVVEAGIPVMGHIGLTPQSVHAMGGFRIQGRGDEARKRLLDDAKALEQAGAYSIVVEGVPAELGKEITALLEIPTIGIGAGKDCDGQVLVCYDMLGLLRGKSPKFVKRFAELGDQVVVATTRYAESVRAGTFPAAEHEFATTTAAEPSRPRKA
ncbi:MAG TPA: 3-methyl-2-oxobutanoate hydroxymethyltransferase [Polyangiaceae bacterium]|jgi:3-methyl-2-oxobutanoate hydroxymethyltransferase|nr:3-methyl-2-oxobutanoate hydroxymethyltransferase [Polyangiaceae bacterium]